MTSLVWAEIIWTKIATWTMPGRIGAVGVAAIVGALIAGLIVQLLSKGVSKQPAPRPAVNLVRLGGAVAAGLGAFLYLFGPGGGYGPGQGPGGEGPGGTEKTSHNDPKDSDSKSSEKKKADGNEGTRTPTELRVGVLSYGALKPDDAKKKRCYRIITAGGPEMKSLGGVKQFIVDLKTPPSVVYLVDFEDAADADRMAADKMLRELAGDLKKNPDQWVKPAPEPHPSPRP